MQDLHKVHGQIDNFFKLKVDPETGEILNPESIMGELEALEINRKEKQKNMILFYKNLQGEDSILDAEIERLRRLKAINENKQNNIKFMLEQSMRASNETELDFTTCKAKIKKNPPSLIIDPGADVSSYTKVEMVEKVDKNAIKKDLNLGKEVEGCKLESKERLDIA